MLTPGEANTQIFCQSLMQIVHTNPASKWSLLDVGLDKFHTMLHKTTFQSSAQQSMLEPCKKLPSSQTP
ncbi:hypothetical protein JVU11DRAFT_11399 [Chiua virens]|nr:hypothetical protein JVU11DRAFT_11399 [Chiua virens]